jgi:hypothetical protein
MVFYGAVCAAAKVNVEVDDENGSPVNNTSPGDAVNVTANATTNDYLANPAVLITVDPKSGLTFKPEKTVMIYDGIKFQNDPANPFFYWDDSFDAWVWYVGWVYGDQYPDEAAQLIAPAIVSDTGKITVNEEYLNWPQSSDTPILIASDSYTFLSTEVETTSGESVPMQDTGTPLAAAAIGILTISGGVIYGKLK